ncbi:hypothetical protein I550_1072 [Mycobacterium intracellulare 1956]|uniref:Uncharacterized protein n=1 Tax=Mycobacterium intracellulare 1956 TaxID=1299331 RepID=X8CRR3_MYCIT|nr:hypothetical protein I550_1072 [Mycobacterium intracellulare 1956]
MPLHGIREWPPLREPVVVNSSRHGVGYTRRARPASGQAANGV